MEATHLSAVGRVLRYGFPIVVMAVIPVFAWAVLALPAIAIQWHVDARDRAPVTVLYTSVVVTSLALYLVSISVAG